RRRATSRPVLGRSSPRLRWCCANPRGPSLPFSLIPSNLPPTRGAKTVTDLPPDYFSKHVSEVDPEIAEVLENELHRQESTLEMIASENFVPQAVLDCQGSVLTNKYAEGYPGKRYYGGCEYVDVAEQLAIDRAKELFGAEHANVQPNGGASANAIVYSTLMEPGDTFLGMKLDHG